MVDKLTGKLDSLVLSATEVQTLTNWPDEMVEDYLNIIRNLALIAQIVDENDLEIITNIQKLQQQIEVDSSFMNRLNAIAKAFKKKQSEHEQELSTINGRISSVCSVVKKQTESMSIIMQMLNNQSAEISKLYAENSKREKEINKNKQILMG